MADPSPSPDTVADIGAEPSHSPSAAYPGTPRWVKVSAIVVVALVVLLLGAHLAGGSMGPMHHMMPAGGR